MEVISKRFDVRKSGDNRMKKEKVLDYSFTIWHLSKEDGGGYLVKFPDLPGCMSDGETIEEAITNGYDAVSCWISAAKEVNQAVPMLYKRITCEHEWPLELKIPNAKTCKAFEETDKGVGLTKCKNADDMFKKLGI